DADLKRAAADGLQHSGAVPGVDRFRRIGCWIRKTRSHSATPPGARAAAGRPKKRVPHRVGDVHVATMGRREGRLVYLVKRRLKDDDTEIGCYQGEGLFLADVIKEQVLLALPLKVIRQSDCRGLCPNCGANLNHEECRCETHATDPRMAPLARLKQDWLKKQ